MTDISFDRLFSMATFEGLRIIRREIAINPNLEKHELTGLIFKIESSANTLDMEASYYLNEIVDNNTPVSGIEFYRECISSILLFALPDWAKLITLGRKRFFQKLYGEEFRDVRSLFRQAGLMNSPPTDSEIEWWDFVSGRVRLASDKIKLDRARLAEKLSLKLEEQRLAAQGITTKPQWIAIEDNTAGYDVLSYSRNTYGLVNKLIEVKSTIASPLRFFITRNEWDHALEVGDAYHFHIWDMQQQPPFLYEKTTDDILPHIPQDNEIGKWQTAIIPLIIS